ncbi:maleylpyruvate isomerase family mycothiol-dependent enzyme [Nakamurella endophytica]|nr:maleylpyruvate isomerase family mycothiol-dependent enzyme [Nakamurella endophytica]
MPESDVSFIDVLAAESERAAAALELAPATARVPACPDWTAADLAFHLAEVQDSWLHHVRQADVSADTVPETERPPDGELVALLRDRSAALVGALRAADPTSPCWSWSPSGGTVSWVRRRQAHEALIHRVDAEQVAGLPVTQPDPALAADGVDEMVTVMLSGLPDWARFSADGTRIRLTCPDSGRSWLLAFGRFVGTSPTSGTRYDEECVEAVTDDPEPATATVSASSWNLDLWLWGRADAEVLDVTGDASAVARLRAVIADSSQ